MKKNIILILYPIFICFIIISNIQPEDYIKRLTLVNLVFSIEEKRQKILYKKSKTK